jgi:glycosyltransferase involved in cell wall biosynthesis
MRILALEPYYGGSHRAFLDGWASRSRHEWTLLTLTPRHWKWRMRHAGITFAGEVRERVKQGERWDAIFCSDMLNLPEFLGLAPSAVRSLPCLVYFHENQLTYPVLEEKGYDYHFAFSNMTTALAADVAWFNSQFHLDTFLEALDKFLRRMPDHQPLEAVDTIRSRSCVRYPGIDTVPLSGTRAEGPIHILWAARWEHDKNPELFFQALDRLDSANIDFQMSVIGGHGGRDPLPCFVSARQRFDQRIRHWGYLESKDAYRSVLAETDIIVSTADHEFFGISVVEAVSAGAIPLVPERLAYPEVLDLNENEVRRICFYSDGAEKLASGLITLVNMITEGHLPDNLSTLHAEIARRYSWDTRVSKWDDEFEAHQGSGIS